MAKLGVFVIDLSRFAALSDIMELYFTKPYSARAAIQAAALPKGSLIKADGIIILSEQL
ncbi:hypothetical protein [Iodobacter ciconiae]|uniref:hypothetical protein n=1 Tax=Iodobacter ciconiae TaxID=2496266 RepID=UPI0035714790